MRPPIVPQSVLVHLQPITVPFREDEMGAMRVGKSHVLLKLVIHAFQAGTTPEAIVQSHHTLELADVYAVGTFSDAADRRGQFHQWT
jgi:hypothetical protein